MPAWVWCVDPPPPRTVPTSYVEYSVAYLSGRRNLGGASCPPTTGMTVQGTLARVIRRKTGSSTATGLTSKPTPPYPLQYKQLQGVRFYASLSLFCNYHSH